MFMKHGSVDIHGRVSWVDCPQKVQRLLNVDHAILIFIARV
jgi:hypothetical protein